MQLKSQEMRKLAPELDPLRMRNVRSGFRNLTNDTM